MYGLSLLLLYGQLHATNQEMQPSTLHSPDPTQHRGHTLQHRYFTAQILYSTEIKAEVYDHANDTAEVLRAADAQRRG